MGKLTTASLIGGETSRSFHYWQPASIWRLLPWLANPGNQAMRPHTGNGNRHLSHWINSGKREGRGGGNCLDEELSLLTTLQVHAQSTCKNASNEDCMEFQCIGSAWGTRWVVRLSSSGTVGWTDQMLANIFKMHKSVLEPRCAASSSILPFSFTD